MSLTKENKTKQSKYTESFLPIKTIANGSYVLNNGQQVTGVKIQPKNIFILEEEAQTNMILNLRNFYNTIDYEFWLFVADRPVDINVYLSQLQLLYNSTQMPTIRKLIKEDLNKANMFMGKEINVTDTEYFILFKDKRPEVIQKRVRSLISNLALCGLDAKQVSNDDLRVLLDGIMNAGVTTDFGTVMGI